MKKIFYSKSVKAIFATMLLFASIHMVILLMITIMRANLVYLNIFYILGIFEFVPGIEKGGLSFILSFIVILVVYSLLYIRSKS